MQRILVSGGAGFIGSHLCERLLRDGHEVACIDNLITGNLHNLGSFRNHERFRFINQDITNAVELLDPVERIYHLASPASPIDYQKLPIETLKVGALGTYHLLELALAKGARILLASTSEVYGDPEAHPQREDYWGHVNPIGPRSVYDEAKRYAEALVMAYHRRHAVDTRIVRIFNTYGPRMRREDGRVVPNFICQALQGKDLTVYGDGSQTRSFCYVDDMVEGILRAMDGGDAEPVNLGNDQERTILEFARAVLALTGSKSRLVFSPLPIDDPKVRCPDIARARRLLGWSPEVSLDSGLAKTIESFRVVESVP